MSVEVQIALSAQDVPVLGTLDVRVNVRNTGPLPLELPGSDDTSAALTFDVYKRGTDKLVRRMNGLTRQGLRTRGRIDAAHDLEVVPAGAALDFTLDLAKYHQPLRTGEYEIQATYAYEPSSVLAVSAKHPLRVRDLGVTAVSAFRDNPVLEGLTVLCEAEDGSVWGRLQNPSRPLAAWWNRPLLLPPGTRGAFAATAGYFQTDTFGDFYQTWVVFPHGAYVVARLFGSGVPSGLQHAAPMPARGRLTRSAVRTRSGELLVFFWSDGLLEGYRLEPAALTKVMEMALPRGLRGEPCVRADEEHLHVVYPDHGLIHAKVGLGGRASTEERIHKSGLTPLHWVYEPSTKRVKGAFLDNAGGRSLELVVEDPGGVSVVRTQLPTRGHVTELAFDRTRSGQTHILYATSRKRLYLVIGERAPALIDSGRDAYFPMILADAPTYIAYVKPGFGHRFYAYTIKKYAPHLVDFETAVSG